MTYSIVRRTETDEAAAPAEEATAAIRLLRDWSAAFPQQRLAIRDVYGHEIAFRRPASFARIR